MENKELLNNPFYCIARDALPVASRKFGLERIALALNLLHDSGTSAEEAVILIQFLFPLTEEEIAEEEIITKQNYNMSKMLGGLESGFNGD